MAIRKKPVLKRPTAKATPSNEGVSNACSKCKTDLLPKEGRWTCPKCHWMRDQSFFGLSTKYQHIQGEPEIIAVQEKGGMLHWALHYPEHNLLIELPWDTTVGNGATVIPQEFGGDMRKLQMFFRSKQFRIIGGPNATS